MPEQADDDLMGLHPEIVEKIREQLKGQPLPSEMQIRISRDRIEINATDGNPDPLLKALEKDGIKTVSETWGLCG